VHRRAAAGRAGSEARVGRSGDGDVRVRRRLARIGLMAALAWLSACGSGGGVREMVGSIEDGLRLARQLEQQTGQSDIVAMVINGQFIGITLENSAWNDLPEEQKREKSLEIARLAYEDYPGGGDLVAIDVSYETRYDVGPLHYRVKGDKFEFFASEFARRAAAGGVGDVGAGGK
ncbi:MAG: hypothetical protein WBF06_15280, partial [Candidatus Acidiferrales bacterium]